MNGLLVLSWLAPLLAAPFALRQQGRWLPAMAAVPALLAVWQVPVGAQWELSWLLLGAQFGLDASGRVFLLFTALLWLVAGLQADLSLRDDPHAGRFRVFFLLAMSGNFWLIVAQDMVNFYLGFALMGLAAYGLVVHDAKPASLHAGRVYLGMTLVAEVALFAALLLIFRHTASLTPLPAQLVGLNNWAVGLLIFGLGIKAGLVLLHVWLPLAHPAAPAPASAVLSGAMIKAALIGWLRFLPLGEEALGGWGYLLFLLGSITVIYGFLVGLVQTNPKVVLAYSSVSKMGLMTALLGLGLANPALAPALLTGLVLFAAHHGLAKGALFLGVGVAHASTARWVVPALAIPALVLAGAPFTSGALTKQLLEAPLQELQGTWAAAMPLLLTLASLATTLLMARFLTLMAKQSKHSANAASWIAAPWLLLLGLILSLPFFSPYALPSIFAGWPLAAGGLLVLLWLVWRPRWGLRLPGIIPAGDILEPLLSLRRRLWPHLAMAGHRASTGVRQAILAMRRPLRPQAGWTLSMEDRLSRWPLAGVLLLCIGASLWLLTRLVT